MQRSARIAIDFEALTHNLSVVRQYSNNAKIMAVIKANAYGHGMLAVARQLEDKVDALAVACVNEARVLRDNGIDAALVILQGFHNQQELDQCLQLNLEPVCHQTWQVDLLSQQSSKQPINCWLKMDSGMHRLGVAAAQTSTLAKKLLAAEAVKELRLMSHFANSDEKDSAINQQQLEVFNESLSTLNLASSMANSAAIFSISESIKDWVRPGLMLYGASPFVNQSASALGLKPVMSLKSHIIAINQLPEGQSIGYGGGWTSSRISQIATVAIGYGDGYPRHASNGTPVSINGQRCALVGRVSMDMLTVDVTDLDTKAKVGDEVLMWGQQIEVVEVAKSATTIAYELLCSAGKDQ